MHRMGSLILILICVPLALPALAVDEVFVEYYQGNYHFDYEQWPWGGYNGTFDASGEILDPDLGWAEGQTQSVGGRLEVIADTLTVWGYGATLNPDATVDVAAVFIRTAGTELTPGNYPVDTDNFMAEFAFFDDVAEFQIPEEGGDMAAWLAALVADQKFFGTTGSISVTEVGEDGFAGSFTGSMADPFDFTIITISNASFDMDGRTVTGLPETPAFASHGNFPNPFNPKTTLRFEMPASGQLRASVFDLQGRLVALLADDHYESGSVELTWNGRDAVGHALPGGVYLYKLETAEGSVSGKMVLLK